MVSPPSLLLATTASAAFALVFTMPMSAQILHAAAPLPSFEVVTIKPWKRTPLPPAPPSDATNAVPKRPAKVDPSSGGERGQRTDRVHMILPIQSLIESAYRLPLSSKQIAG